ncbi:hypothetical protein [Sandarakinorhabdus limnophila]|jgi:hypothetical protein|uniref:hypothetical protein n=1 Tax=Sandarakinorhabdus limnophila TaxID=210512 RepID=UPI0026F1ECD2|nr:hypothetical protein [Sandarakinorhabdus limnophila]MCM0033857.1 hypothetical protein [Sandarakinorhabdus limnophila]
MLRTDAATAPAGPDGLPPSLPALPRSERGWTWWVGTIITLAVLVAAMLQLAQLDLARVAAIVPSSPAFWLVFALSYFAGPLGDYAIFRRLWQIPVAGFFALLRKLIGNELITGYVGDLYFYTWARQRTSMTSAPFGAVKDVAILSAMAANAVTLVLMVLAYPLLDTLHLGIDSTAFFASVALMLVISSGVLFFRKKLFSLPAPDLWVVTFVQTARVIATLVLTGLCWHLALPAESVELWVLLSAMRMLLSRLPFLPNKDVVFAALAVFMIGQDAEVGALMAMMASLLLATHLGLGLLLVSGEAAGWRKK